MKQAIIYKTINGSTRKYAEWLSQDLKIKTFEMDSFKDFDKYDSLIVMSGTYAGRMPLTDFLKKNWKLLESKELIIVAVGAVPASNWWSRISYIMIPGKIRKHIKYFKIYGKAGEESPEIKKENLKPVLDYIKRKDI